MSNTQALFEKFMQRTSAYANHSPVLQAKEQTVDMHTQITTFETSAAQCNRLIKSSSKQEICDTLEALCKQNSCNIVKSEYVESLLSVFADRFLTISSGLDRDEITQDSLITLEEAYSDGKKLATYLRAVHKKESQTFLSRLTGIGSSPKTNKTVTVLNERLEAIYSHIQHTSELLSQHLVDSNKEVYCFLCAALGYARLHSDTMFEISLSALIDRLLFILEPVLETHSLQNPYLLHYHLYSELQELHRSIICDI